MRRAAPSLLTLVAVMAAPATARAATTQEKATLAATLREACQACHGLGPLRFLRSEDPESVWDTLHAETVPGTRELWKDAIVAALSWPTSSPPPAGTFRAPGKEWMPKGAKRLSFAQDRVGDETARDFVLRLLRP